jgi:transmembrane sensor
VSAKMEDKASSMREASESEAADWIARRERDNWSHEQSRVLEAWLEASWSNRVAYLRLNAVWQEANRLQALAGNTDLAPLRSRTRWLRWALAASIFLGIALSLTLALWPRGSMYRTAIGKTQTVPISDGSRVTLNTDTRLRVAVNDDRRTVDLQQGEAFFEVVADPRRPFVVTAADQRIIVLGTEFAVRRAGNEVRVVVTEGKVQIERLGRREPKLVSTQLEAGNIARTGAAGVLVENKPIEVAEESLSWRAGFLTFRQIPLAEVAAEFNRYNERKVTVADPGIAAMRIGGTFRATNADAFARLMEEAFPINVELRSGEIVLTAR